MDPLSVLRQFVTEAKLQQVVTDGDRINFGEAYSFPKHVYTAFRANRGTGDHCALEQLLVFIQHIGAGPGEYIKRCQQLGLQPVLVIDRKVCC